MKTVYWALRMFYRKSRYIKHNYKFLIQNLDTCREYNKTKKASAN